MRLHARRAFGDLVSIFMLDQRQYRSRPECFTTSQLAECPELLSQERTMLGGRQEGWLYGGLGSSRAHWNLMAQGTVMSLGEEQTSGGRLLMSDGWNGYPAARSRLLNFIESAKVRNPVMLAGDIHAFLVGSLLRDDADLAAQPVASELVTTSITSQGASQEYFDARRAASAELGESAPQVADRLLDPLLVLDQGEPTVARALAKSDGGGSTLHAAPTGRSAQLLYTDEHLSERCGHELRRGSRLVRVGSVESRGPGRQRSGVGQGLVFGGKHESG
jgi:hypothetical protein